MRRGLDDFWTITDAFSQDWRFWIVPIGDAFASQVMSIWDLPEDPLFHIIQFSFDDERALVDEAASDLLAIYDALTGSRLNEELPEPTNDPQRRLVGFREELRRELYTAIEAGVLKFEREDVPWPFREKEEKPEERRKQQAKDEEMQPVAFRVLRLKDNSPIADATAVILYPDGREMRHKTDKDGWVRMKGLPGQVFELLRVLHPHDEQHELAVRSRPSSSSAA